MVSYLSHLQRNKNGFLSLFRAFNQIKTPAHKYSLHASYILSKMTVSTQISIFVCKLITDVCTISLQLFSDYPFPACFLDRIFYQLILAL